MKNAPFIVICALAIFPFLAVAQTTFTCPSDWICFPKTIIACPIGFVCIRYTDGFRIETRQAASTSISDASTVPTTAPAQNIITSSSTPVTLSPENVADINYYASLSKKPAPVIIPVCSYSNAQAGNPICIFNTKSRPEPGNCPGGSITYNDNLASFVCTPNQDTFCVVKNGHTSCGG